MSRSVGRAGSIAPVAVFAYNRPDKIASLLASLQTCQTFNASPVKIFVDGPKGEVDASAVADVRDYIRGLALPNVTYFFHESNLGLRNSIFNGVSELVARYGKVIVLEDDLVLSPIALDYFNAALHHYEMSERVWSIAGYMYDSPELGNRQSTLCLPFTHPWGWATWARAWERFDLDRRPDSLDLQSKSFETAFDMKGVYPFTKQLKNSLAGRVNSWSIHWYYTVFEHGGVTIFPPRRVVDNTGFNDGTHGSGVNPYKLLAGKSSLLEEMPQLGDGDQIDYAAMDLMRNCRELRIRRMIAHIGTARRALVQRGAR